jgi:hypothetical protein
LRTNILDRHMRHVPDGVIGEQNVGGAGDTRGYLNRPELNQERYLRDPFASRDDASARLYRTGDLARYREDGTIDYLGRNDAQVKVRGFRIELGEIETALQSAPGVGQAVVLARDEAGGDKRLVAYIVMRADQEAQAEFDIAALRAHLSLTLAEYMLPSAFVTLEALPLTPNGKLDRKALPAPDQAAFLSRGYEPPQGIAEETLAAIWAQLLNRSQVGRGDNFFELGGHSLMAVTVIERMQGAGMKLDVGALFAMPTLADLARAVEFLPARPDESEDTIEEILL